MNNKPFIAGNRSTEIVFLPIEQIESRAELQRKLDRRTDWLVFAVVGFVCMTMLFLYVCATR